MKSAFISKTMLSLVGASLVLMSQTALAQSTGIKLGTGQTESTPKLDLGAAPAPNPNTQQNQSASAADVQRAVYGSWEVACLKSGAECAMAQIGQDANGTPILEMVVRKLKEPLESEGKVAVAVVDFITPLGVVLVSGLELKIDSGRGEVAPFQICTEQGCLVREPVDQALIDRFLKGNSAQVTVVAANQGEVKANLSLQGFTKAYNSLN